MAPVPARGRLEELPAPLLLVRLGEERFGGALLLRRDRVSRRVLFRAGRPVAAEATPAGASLAAQLLAAGGITAADATRVLEQTKQQRCREEKALLDLKLCGPKELLVALREQLRRRILDVFGWTQGEWQLDATQEAPPDAHALGLDVLPLAQEGVSAHWSAERTLAVLAPHGPHFALPGPTFARVARRLQRDGAVEALLAALDGARTLADALGCARTPLALAAAFVLDAAGSLEYREGPAEEQAPEAPAPAAIEIVVVGGPSDTARNDHAPANAARAEAGAGARSAEAESLRSDVLQKHARLKDLDHYELLDVARNADASAIKRAYFQAAKRFHPDALARLGLEDLNRQANELFARIAKAHSVLSDLAQRRDYDDAMGAEGDIDGDRLATAESLYRKGEVLVRMGAFADALQYLQPAVDLWPDESAYRGALGWALYKKTPSEPKPAREHLQRAVALDAKSGVALYRLGVVLRALGESEAGEQAIARAKQLDPKAAAG